MSRPLVLEGATGTGKTSLLAALKRTPGFTERMGNGRIATEEETFGDLMAELADPERDDRWRCRRMPDLLKEIESLQPGRRGGVLERFHLSYFALMPQWDLYLEVDRRLSRIDARQVLLVVPEEAIRARSLERPDRKGTAWEAEMIGAAGGADAAVASIVASQRRRKEALRLTTVKTLTLDTGTMAWDGLAAKIVDFWDTDAFDL